MANYCANRLTITGDASELNAFILENQGDNIADIIDMNKSVPIASEFTDDGSDFWGTELLMDFSREDNWEVSSTATNRSISFFSKWSTPYLWIFEVVKKYPFIEFRLEGAEAGNYVYVVLTGANGSTLMVDKGVTLESMAMHYFKIADAERKIDRANSARVSLKKFMNETPHKEMAQFLLEEGILFDA